MFFLPQSQIRPPFQDKLLMFNLFDYCAVALLANFFSKNKENDSIIFKSNLREK
jgi:hypothetical protein